MLDRPTFDQGSLISAPGRWLPGVVALMVVVAVLAIPPTIQAQRGGGGGGRGLIGTGTGTGPGRPDGVSDKDDLKNFHRAMAIQATAEQRAAFAKVAQYVQAASDRLQAFREFLQKASGPSPLPERAATLDQAIGQARAGNQNFLASFSSQQKSGLEDATKKLAKADSELDKELKELDQIVQAPKPDAGQASNAAAGVEKTLTNFQNEQLALGREMSILFDPSQGVTFSLPPVTNSIMVDGQSISIPASGAVSRTATPASGESGSNIFRLKLVADLSDLQQNIAGILRSRINRSPRCGERIEILDATLTPLAPASLLVANLHFERWVCAGGAQGNAMEVAGGVATLEVKLTPTLEPATGLQVGSEMTRVEAEGLLRDSLRSGDLGVTLREQMAASLLAALQKVADLKATLPPAARESAALQKAEFQDDGADQMSLVLDGQLQLTDAQTQQFAAQLKQRLSAQGTITP